MMVEVGYWHIHRSCYRHIRLTLLKGMLSYPLPGFLIQIPIMVDAMPLVLALSRFCQVSFILEEVIAMLSDSLLVEAHCLLSCILDGHLLPVLEGSITANIHH